LFRPPEAVLATACVMAALITDIHGKRLRLSDAGYFLAGAALPVVPYALLYLHIYGLHPTEYTLISQKIGFTLYDIGWKAYVLLIEPRGWFMDGEGLLRRAPWIALGIGGIVPALARSRGPTKLLAVVLVLHAVLYLSYVDLLPTGFWRYNNVHYWTWILPGYGLLGLLLVRDLVRPQSRRGAIIAWASLTATGLMLCVQLEPRPASADEPAKMIEFPGIRSGFDNIYFGYWVLHDGSGDLGNVSFVRGVPTPGGLRVLALRRPIAGAVTWAANPAGWQITQSPLRWRIGISIGLPCWVGFLRCPSPPVSGLLPPPPP